MTAPSERKRRVRVMDVVTWLVVTPNWAAREGTVRGTAK